MTYRTYMITYRNSRSLRTHPQLTYNDDLEPQGGEHFLTYELVFPSGFPPYLIVPNIIPLAEHCYRCRGQPMGDRYDLRQSRVSLR